MMVNVAAERGPVSAPSIESKALIVSQPKRLEGLLMEINTLGGEAIRETSAGGPSSTWTGGAGDGAQGTTGVSPRDQAIARIPADRVMRSALERHIEVEIRTLRSQAQRLTRLARPGAAFRLNALYARIRRLSGLLREFLNASADTIRRVFIRVFIDKQPILQDR